MLSHKTINSVLEPQIKTCVEPILQDSEMPELDEISQECQLLRLLARSRAATTSKTTISSILDDYTNEVIHKIRKKQLFLLEEWP